MSKRPRRKKPTAPWGALSDRLTEILPEIRPLLLHTASTAADTRHRGVLNAEDIVEAAIVRALEATEEIPNLAGWLVLTVRNCALEAGRMLQADPAQLFPKSGDVENAPAESEPPPALPERIRAAHAQLPSAFKRLPRQDQRLLRALFWEDKPIEEIAHRRGVTRQAIQQQQRNALTRLSRLLGGPAVIPSKPVSLPPLPPLPGWVQGRGGRLNAGWGSPEWRCGFCHARHLVAERRRCLCREMPATAVPEPQAA